MGIPSTNNKNIGDRKEQAMTTGKMLCGATTKAGKPCKLPAQKGQDHCWRHVSPNIVPTDWIQSVREALNGKEEMSTTHLQGAPMHYMVVTHEAGFAPDVTRRIVTNMTHEPSSEVKLKDGEYLVPANIGDEYRFAFLEQFLADTPYWVEFVPNTEEYNPQRYANSQFRMSDEETVTVFYTPEYPEWGQVFEALGVKISPSMKFNKRAKEFTRISRYYRHFTAGQVTVNIFDPSSDEIETYDGQTIIRPSFFKKMARNKADRLHLEHHGKNGSFRLLSDRGLIKGDFIVARSDEDLDYDVVTSSDNLKHELCFEDEQYFCTFFLHHDHHAPVTDVQSLSWLGEHIFGVELMGKQLAAEATKVLTDVMEGNFPQFMLQDDALGAKDLDSSDDDTIAVLHNQYQRWQNAGLSLNQSAYFLHTIGQGYLNHMRRGMRFPIPHATYTHVTTHELLEMAGYNVSAFEGVVFYHDATGRLSFPGELFKAIFSNHGGWDLDDSVRVLVRKFNGEVKGFLLRSPNAWGEYSIVDIDLDSLEPVLYNTDDMEIPEVGMSVEDFKDKVHPIQRVDSNVHYAGLPSGGLTIGNEYTPKLADQMIEALGSAPSIGGWANSQMVYYASVGDYRKSQLAHTEDIVDCLTQSVNPVGFEQVTKDIEATLKELATLGVVDEYFVKHDIRVPKKYRKSLTPFKGHLTQLHTVHATVMNTFEKKLKEVSNASRKPIDVLLDEEAFPVSAEAMGRAKKAEQWYRGLADDAPRGKDYVFSDNAKFQGASSMMLKHNAFDFWRDANRVSVRTCLGSDNAAELIVAMYRYSEVLRGYGKENGIDRFLFSPNYSGDISIMDVLIAAYETLAAQA